MQRLPQTVHVDVAKSMPSTQRDVCDKVVREGEEVEEELKAGSGDGMQNKKTRTSHKVVGNKDKGRESYRLYRFLWSLTFPKFRIK